MAEDRMPRDGSVALVTGAGTGIGRATAEALVEIGCRVICAGRRVDRLEPVAAALGEAAFALSLDVTDPASVESLFDRLPEPWRAIDILVNSAGHDVGGRRRFDEGSAEEWAAIIETNVTGLVRVTRKLIDGMIARDYGHVVNIGSVAGLRAYETGTLYAASKFAVRGFTESLRLDYRNTGLRVTEVLPGMVRTEFALARWADEAKAAAFYDDFGVCLEPEDVAHTVVFALQQPAHVVISALVVVPSAQS